MATTDGMNPGDEYEDFMRQFHGIQCERCGERKFHWGKYKGRLRLFNNDDDKLHICSQPKETVPKGGYTCKRCGATGMHWGQYNGTWRLHDKDNVLHVCHRIITKGN